MISKTQLMGIQQHLETAVLNTFDKQVGLPVDCHWTDEINLSVDCMSIITLKTDLVAGAISIGFPEPVLLKVIEKLLGETHEKLSSLNADASGELLNIVYTSARVHINQLGFQFQPTIPATILGRGLQLSQAHSGPPFSLFCSSAAGSFRLMFSIKQVQEKTQ